MLSASEARNTGFSITAHVRTLCCDFCGINTDFESILEGIFWVEDKETLNLSPNRKKRYRRLFSTGQDCLIVEATAESLKRALRLNK